MSCPSVHAAIQIEFLEQPTNAHVLSGFQATFHVAARASEDGVPVTPVTYQWQYRMANDVGWLKIDGATSDTYTTPPPAGCIVPNAFFRCIVTAGNIFAISAEAGLIQIADGNCPEFSQVESFMAQNAIIIHFSQPMRLSSLEDQFNYLVVSSDTVPDVESIAVLGPDRVRLKFTADRPLRPNTAYQLISSGDLYNDSASPCFCNFIASGKAISFRTGSFEFSFTEQPASVVVQEYSMATFKATATATLDHTNALPLAYQWQVFSPDLNGWESISWATNSVLTMLVTNCHPIDLRCQAKFEQSLTTSAVARLTVVVDCSPPSVWMTWANSAANTITIAFDEPMDPTYVQDIFNYDIFRPNGEALDLIEATIIESGFGSSAVVLKFNAPSIEPSVPYRIVINHVGNLSDPDCGCKWILPDTTVYATDDGCLGVGSQPLSQSVLVNCRATFQVSARPEIGRPNRHLTYQWFRNDTPISRATNATYVTPPVAFADNGARYRVEITESDACAATASSSNAVITVLADQVPLRLVQARTGLARDLVILDFVPGCDRDHNRFTPETALDPANYELSGGLSVRSLEMDCDRLAIHLLTSPQIPGETYSVRVNHLQDLFGNEVIPDSLANFYVSGSVLPVPPGQLQLFSSDDERVLAWAGDGILQSAENLAGPWQDQSDAKSPYYLGAPLTSCRPPSGPPVRYYRVRWP